ncbi:MAG: TolC family protein [Kordiimonadaceae bacterium]|jgi:outer membrane protein, heavy metal efflux system|nr:TolC family protein [Kordiimonadaceae bacterium]MBT6328137.1 TolC family protein [Kordiimonadaceae bacterium]MBT7581504.1 TolC family protein [Kordiimonadaceae bacterium]
MLYRLLFIALVTWHYGAGAQQNEALEFEITPSETVTVQDVVNAALSLSPDGLVVSSKEQNADALSAKASSLFSDTPAISFQLQNDRYFSNQGMREYEGGVDLPLWMPGQKAASRQKARVSSREAEAYQDLVLFSVTGQVREMLWEITLADAALQQSRDNLKIAVDLDRDISKKITAGNLPRRDELLSQKEIMSRKMALVEAEAEYIHAAREYEAITGLLEMPAYFDEEVNHENDGESVPLLELAQAKVDFMEAQYRVSKSSWSRAPTLSVGVKRESGSFLDRNIDSFGVGFSVPLGSGVHMTSKRAAAAVELAQAERENELVKRDHRLHLHEAEHDLEVCEIQLPYSSSHFEMAQENLRLSQKAFDMGESDLIELLKVQEQYFQSSAENSQKIIECKRSIARHNQIKGVLLP